MTKIQIFMWKVLGRIWDIRPRLHLPKYTDYPIASCEIQEVYEYPEGIRVLFEWDEKGKHWIVFSR